MHSAEKSDLYVTQCHYRKCLVALTDAISKALWYYNIVLNVNAITLYHIMWKFLKRIWILWNHMTWSPIRFYNNSMCSLLHEVYATIDIAELVLYWLVLRLWSWHWTTLLWVLWQVELWPFLWKVWWSLVNNWSSIDQDASRQTPNHVLLIPFRITEVMNCKFLPHPF